MYRYTQQSDVHRLYTESLMNPFTTPHSKITSKRFDAGVTSLVQSLNGNWDWTLTLKWGHLQPLLCGQEMDLDVWEINGRSGPELESFFYQKDSRIELKIKTVSLHDQQMKMLIVSWHCMGLPEYLIHNLSLLGSIYGREGSLIFDLFTLFGSVQKVCTQYFFAFCFVFTLAVGTYRMIPASLEV